MGFPTENEIEIIPNTTPVWFRRRINENSTGVVHTGVVIGRECRSGVCFYIIRCRFKKPTSDVELSKYFVEGDENFYVQSEDVFTTEADMLLANEPPSCPSENECTLANEFFNNDDVDRRLKEVSSPMFIFEDDKCNISIEVNKKLTPKQLKVLRETILDSIYRIQELIPNGNK